MLLRWIFEEQWSFTKTVASSDLLSDRTFAWFQYIIPFIIGVWTARKDRVVRALQPKPKMGPPSLKGLAARIHILQEMLKRAKIKKDIEEIEKLTAEMKKLNIQSHRLDDGSVVFSSRRVDEYTIHSTSILIREVFVKMFYGDDDDDDDDSAYQKDLLDYLLKWEPEKVITEILQVLVRKKYLNNILKSYIKNKLPGGKKYSKLWRENYVTIYNQ